MLMGRLSLAFVATSLCMTGAPLLAQGSLPDQLAVCARIGKKDARLECYDSIARAAGQGSGTSDFGASSMRAPQAPPPSAVPPPPPSPGASAAAASGFGSEQISRPLAERRADAGADEVSMAVLSSRDNGLSMWQFNLQDGAIWKMTERVANFRPPAPNETVTIRKASLGSYLMQVGRQGAVRVERVR